MTPESRQVVEMIDRQPVELRQTVRDAVERIVKACSKPPRPKPQRQLALLPPDSNLIVGPWGKT